MLSILFLLPLPWLLGPKAIRERSWERGCRVVSSDLVAKRPTLRCSSGHSINLMYKCLRFPFSLPGQMLSIWVARKPFAAIFFLGTEVEPLSLATMVLNRKYKRPARRAAFGDWKHSDKSKCSWHRVEPVIFQFHNS